MNTLLLFLFILILFIAIWSLFGGSDSSAKEQIAEDNLPFPERRKRRDEDEIGEQNNQPEASPRKRRKSDYQPESEILPVNEDFSMPHSSESIFPEDSPYQVYKKVLQNAEMCTKKGDFETAKTFYEGVKNRINDPQIFEKIDEDLDYLNNYQQILSKQSTDQTQSSNSDREIKLSFEGSDSLPDKIQITLPETQQQDINIDHIADKISEKFNQILPASETPDYEDITTNMHDKINEIENIKEKIENLDNKYNEENTKKENSEINDLKSKIEKLQSEKENEALNEINNLKNKISQIENEKNNELQILKDKENEALKQKLSALENKLDKLESIEDKINQMEENEINNQPINDTINDKTDQIKEEEEEEAINKSINDAINEKIDQIHKDKETEELNVDNIDLSDISKEKSQPSTVAPSTVAPSTVAPSPEISEKIEEKTIVNKPDNKEEDKKDDFELVKDVMNEDNFDEPSEDEVYEKILKDTIESHGQRKKENKETKSNENEIDYNQVFATFQNQMIEDEEKFYSKILQKSKLKKKELPILKVTYNFANLPDEVNISREQNVLEHSFYKYKPMLEKANQYIKQRKVKNAIDYYKVVADQNIPDEFRLMIKQNIKDLNEYLEKYFGSL